MQNSVIEYLKYVDSKVTGSSFASNNIVSKPNFYIVCPCSGSQCIDKSKKPAPLNNIVCEKVGCRPFDSYAKHNTFFEAVLAEQGNLTKAYELYNGDEGKYSPYNVCWENNNGKMFCLSTAWGIIRADFEIPRYGIAFSKANNTNLNTAGDYCDLQWRNGMKKAFNDLCICNVAGKTIPIVMIGGGLYVKRFLHLAKNVQNPVVIFTRNDSIINMCMQLNIPYVKANTKKRTNWYYDYMKQI